MPQEPFTDRRRGSGFWTAYIVANADALPVWKAGDEFEATRKKALAALEQ